ncbi:S-layer homology domain-containing protein [Paenibacillus sp. P46E]|uniref:S-layer homology domain-containing protein n=1 Tax=Paenibacillus sp. P46E TaxID=1349436 RepID=UPI00093C2752|nr:hypothetical protein A3849_12605 [Paenibacillus sp. P46E]
MVDLFAKKIRMPHTNFTSKTGIILPSANETAPFVDQASISGWAADSITALQRADIISGWNNKFLPGSSITRAEAAVNLAKFIKLSK